jgi:hypothetical protein
MISPLMELNGKNLRGKPLGLVSFTAKYWASEAGFAVVFQAKLAGTGMREEAWRRGTGAAVQRLFRRRSPW